MGAGPAQDDLERARADLELVEAVATGEPSAVEAGLLYLEADPWRYRSGYVKQRILTFMRRHELDADQRARLDDVLLRYVDIGERSEFPEACKTARRFQSVGLRDDLVRRLYSTDLGCGVRATRMVTSLRHPRLSSQDLERAHELLLRWAEERHQLSAWTSALVRRLWTPEWGEELLAEAVSTGRQGRAARRLLESVM